MVFEPMGLMPVGEMRIVSGADEDFPVQGRESGTDRPPHLRPGGHRRERRSGTVPNVGEILGRVAPLFL